MTLRARAWRRTAHAIKRVLPRRVREPIEQRIGERINSRKVIDLWFARVLREAPEAALRDRGALEQLLAEVGLNDELQEQFPTRLHPFTGRGLRLWQLPNQFAPYLQEVASHGVRRYLEIGVRHGGSFVSTVEYLNRFIPLDEAVAVDIEPIPSLLPYPLAQPSVKLMQADTQTSEFEEWVARHGPFDLVLIDGLHTLEACRRDFESVRRSARLIAVHDIVNRFVPDVGLMWRDIQAAYADEFEFLEFVEQYDPVSDPALRNMGIGLARRRDPEA